MSSDCESFPNSHSGNYSVEKKGCDLSRTSIQITGGIEEFLDEQKNLVAIQQSKLEHIGTTYQEDVQNEVWTWVNRVPYPI